MPDSPKIASPLSQYRDLIYLGLFGILSPLLLLWPVLICRAGEHPLMGS